jgi:arabinose-5-phosphate isomerase
MNAMPLTIEPDILASEALRVMNARTRPITSLFVLGPDRHPLGVIHVHDLIKAGIE